MRIWWTVNVALAAMMVVTVTVASGCKGGSSGGSGSFSAAEADKIKRGGKLTAEEEAQRAAAMAKISQPQKAGPAPGQ